MPAHGDEASSDREPIADAVAAALGIEAPTDLVAERPPIADRDLDDGTNEAIRLRVLLSNGASSDTPVGFDR